MVEYRFLIQTALPTELSANYLESVNLCIKKDDLKEVQHSIIKGTLFGNDDWVGDMVRSIIWAVL